MANIRNLMTHAEDTAGGLMNTEVIKVDADMFKKNRLLIKLSSQSEEIEEFYTIYVADHDDVLKGIVSVKIVIVKAKANVRKFGFSEDGFVL
jgi:magnesium transporter